jgi:hypothetical protein
VSVPGELSREELVALVAAQAAEIMMLRGDNEDLRVRLARSGRQTHRPVDAADGSIITWRVVAS